MAANEIKKAWNTFKKEIAKEVTFINLTGACYMNRKQLENGTATISLACNIPYDTEIARCYASIERVNGYTTWTDAEKKNNEEYYNRGIKAFENRKATYGTPANEAKTEYNAIIGSKAFQKLAAAIGINHTELELVSKGRGLDVFQVRIHY